MFKYVYKYWIVLLEVGSDFFLFFMWVGLEYNKYFLFFFISFIICLIFEVIRIVVLVFVFKYGVWGKDFSIGELFERKF